VSVQHQGESADMPDLLSYFDCKNCTYADNRCAE
jgi:hypothetical protein